MKKTVFIIVTALLLAMCGTTKGTKSSTGRDAKTEKKADVQYKDDFRAATDKEKAELLKSLKAEGAGYSVLILTKNFKGEKIIISNANKTLRSGYLFTNLKSGIAETIRIDNTIDTKIFDNLTKKTAIIEAREAQKHKFIYLMKNTGNDTGFTITYSNTLRPLD